MIENRKYMPRATAVKQHLVDNVLLSEGSSRKADTLYSFQGVVPANRADDRASYETGRFLALLLCYWQHRPHLQLDRRLRDVVPEELIRRPAPEKWSIAEIVAHLADAELAMGWRCLLDTSSDRA